MFNLLSNIKKETSKIQKIDLFLISTNNYEYNGSSSNTITHPVLFLNDKLSNFKSESIILNKPVIKNINGEFDEESNNPYLYLKNLYSKIPKFSITTIYSNDDSSIFHKVLFENKFTSVEGNYLNQSAFNYYKIGVELIEYLSSKNLIKISDFMIDLIDLHSTCSYCETEYRLKYDVFYKGELLFSTSHNGINGENNCPFLLTVDDELHDENYTINPNVIQQLLFEAIKVLLKGKLNFYICENNSIKNKKELNCYRQRIIENLSTDNFKINFHQLSRIQEDDCCIGKGKDGVFKKAINVYKTILEKKDLKSLNFIFMNNLFRIEFNENSAKFLDLKNNCFGEIKDFNYDYHNRIKMMDNIAYILAKQYNPMIAYPEVYLV